MTTPNLDDEKLREAYLQNLREGMRRGSAGEALNMTRTHVFGYIAEHPAFEMRVVDAEGEATEHIEEAMWQAAASGNVTAMRMWLDREDDRKGKVRKQTPLAEAIGGRAPGDSSGGQGKVVDDVEAFLQEFDD